MHDLGRHRLLWTIAGGVPAALGLIDEALAQETQAASPSCRSATATSASTSPPTRTPRHAREAVGQDQRAARPSRPSCSTPATSPICRSRPSSTTPTRSSAQARLDVHYVPGEHDVLDDEQGKPYRERYGHGTQGRRLVQLRRQRRALRRPGQCRQPEGRRPRQSRRRAARLARGRSARAARPRQPIVVFAHIPLWTVYPNGAGAREDSAQALACSSASAR